MGYTFRVFVSEGAAALAAPNRVFHSAENATLRLGSGGPCGFRNPIFARVRGTSTPNLNVHPANNKLIVNSRARDDGVLSFLFLVDSYVRSVRSPYGMFEYLTCQRLV